MDGWTDSQCDAENVNSNIRSENKEMTYNKMNKYKQPSSRSN